MPKHVRFLVISIDDEVTIHDTEALKTAGIDDKTAAECFGDNAYWLTIELKACNFGVQQRVTREAGADDTLVPQKRFVAAVQKWSKRYTTQESTSILPVSEEAFLELDPPALGNRINAAILADWYPGASKAEDFFQEYRKKQKESEKAKASRSTKSTPAS